MTTSLALYLALTLCFALWVTVHVVLAVAFLLASRFRHATLSFLVVPVAPVLAFRGGHRVLAALWSVSALGYLVLLAIAQR